MRGETFEQTRERCNAQQAVGDALAEAHYEIGGRITEEQLSALRRNSMFGSDSYPVRRLGRGWIYESIAAGNSPLYKTKREAICAWEILIDKWIRLKGLEAQASARSETI